MNAIGEKNYLLVYENRSVAGELFKLAIKFAERCDLVLYLSPKQLNKLPENEKHDREILKRIIFMYCGSHQQLTEKLLDLHTWSIAPQLIIIDSLHDFSTSCQRELEIDKYALTISSLFNCLQFLKNRLNVECTSVVSLDTSKCNINWQLLIDLYYYKNTIGEIKSIMSER